MGDNSIIETYNSRLVRPLVTDINNELWGISHLKALKPIVKTGETTGVADVKLLRGARRKMTCNPACEHCQCPCNLAIDMSTCNKMEPIRFRGNVSIPYRLTDMWSYFYYGTPPSAAIVENIIDFENLVDSYTFDFLIPGYPEDSITCAFYGSGGTSSEGEFDLRASLTIFAGIDEYTNPQTGKVQKYWGIKCEGATFSKRYAVESPVGPGTMDISISTENENIDHMFPFENCQQKQVGYFYNCLRNQENTATIILDFHDTTYDYSGTIFLCDSNGKKLPVYTGTLSWQLTSGSAMPDTVNLSMQHAPTICDCGFKDVIAHALDQIKAGGIILPKQDYAYESDLIPIYWHPDWYIYAKYSIVSSTLNCCYNKTLLVCVVNAGVAKTLLDKQKLSDQYDYIDTLYGALFMSFIPLFYGELLSTSNNCVKCTPIAASFDPFFSTCDCTIKNDEDSYVVHYQNCCTGGAFSVE